MVGLYYESNDWANVTPLKSQSGNERAKTVTVYSSTVALDTKSRKRLSPGTLLVKITSGTGLNKYGPYDGTASDGRQTPAEDGVVFTWEALDVTLGDAAVAGLYAQCVFDKSALTTGGYSLHSTPLTNIKTYFPSCIFDD